MVLFTECISPAWRQDAAKPNMRIDTASVPAVTYTSWSTPQCATRLRTERMLVWSGKQRILYSSSPRPSRKGPEIL
jgi:hypothetical protein